MAGALEGLRADVLEALGRAGGARRFAAGVVLTGLHQSLCTLVLLVGAFSNDPFALFAVTAAAAFILALNVLLHTCPLTVMEEERWGYSNTKLCMRATEWLLGAAPGKDTYTVQMQYIVLCCSALAVKLLLALLAGCAGRAAAGLGLVAGWR